MNRRSKRLACYLRNILSLESKSFLAGFLILKLGENVETLVLCKPSKLCRIQKVYITASGGRFRISLAEEGSNFDRQNRFHPLLKPSSLHLLQIGLNLPIQHVAAAASPPSSHARVHSTVFSIASLTPQRGSNPSTPSPWCYQA